MEAEIAKIDVLLKQLNCYPHALRIRSDIRDALPRYPGLGIACDVIGMRRPHHQHARLLFLTGTIPIVFKQVRYNVPVQIWLTELYPNERPLCFVTPTPDMVIKDKHLHVDLAGVVYHIYLSQWNTACTTTMLISHMIKVFSDDPPVRAKPPNPQPPLQSSYSDKNLNPPVKVSVASPPVQVVNSDNTQKLPTAYSTLPYPSMEYRPNPPVPAVPVTYESELMESPFIVYTASKSPSNEAQTKTIRAPPPKVPEPDFKQKACFALQAKLQPFSHHCVEQIDLLTLKSTEIEKRQQESHLILSNLMRQKEDLDAQIAQLADDEVKLRTWMAENQNLQNSFDVDKDTQPPSVISQQLLSLIAEDAAIEDIIYQLGKALDNDVINADEYLRTVRRLSREQFLKRATVKKINTVRAESSNQIN